MKALNKNALVLSLLMLSSAAIAVIPDELQLAQGSNSDISQQSNLELVSGNEGSLSVSSAETAIPEKNDADVFKKAEAYIDPYLAISRSRAISAKRSDVELAKLKLEEASIESQLSALNQKMNTQSAVESAKEEQMNELAQIRSELEALKQRSSQTQQSKKANNEIYVTKIFGVDGDFVATIYHNNNVYKKHAGETIIPGVVVEKIDINGVSIKQNGKVRNISLSQSKAAFEKAFDRNDSAYSIPPGMNGVMMFPENGPRAQKM